MIILNFHPLHNGSTILVRGAHFRICADASLRGPDNSVAARYLAGVWHLGHKHHVSFDCTGSIHLRVTDMRGRRECIGPYDFIRTAHGAIFAGDVCLGIHATGDRGDSPTADVWQEVSFLTSV